ncbi:hypothetical protein Tco_0269364 [Tanacetum coccineum]
MALPPREQRHKFLRYEGLEYTDADIADFESRLERIYTREIHRVHVVDFQGMPEILRDGLFARMAMEHRDEAGVVVFTSQAWGRLFGNRGPLVWDLILEFLSMLRFREVLLDLDAPGFARYWRESERMIPGKGDLYDYWRDISTDGDFLGPSPSYTLIRDPVLRLCHRMMVHSIAGRSQAPEKVTVTNFFYLRGLDVGSVNIPYLLARYLGDIPGELTVIAPELPIIDMAELPDAVAGAFADAEDALIVDEGGQADPAPVQAPQQPPPPPPVAARTIPQMLGRLEEDVQGLRRDVGSLHGLVERSMTDQGRFSTWMMTCMTQLMDASGMTYQAFDGTF